MVRKTRESASVRLGGLGSVSLPVEGDMDSLGKVASETVSDPALYERFFKLMDGFLVRPQAAPPAQASAPAAPPAPRAAALAVDGKGAAAGARRGAAAAPAVQPDEDDTLWLDGETFAEDAPRATVTRVSKKRAARKKGSRRRRAYY